MIRVVSLALSLVFIAACGFHIITAGEDRRTPLEKAAQEGNISEVKRLLAAGADPNEKASPRACPLCMATVRTGNTEVIRELLAAGADPNGRVQIPPCWGPPLHLALYEGDLDSARLLVDAGASLESPCALLTVGSLKPALLDFVVRHGYNLQAVDEQGMNHLHQALAPPMLAPLETIEYLVRAGVPLNARDHLGKTPLAYWRQPRYYEEHWFATWLDDRVFGDGEWGRQRDLRAKVSAFLERSGAVL
jgi:cytohesin